MENIFQNWLFSYGYNNIRTPIVEDTKLFIRSIGEVTDIVELAKNEDEKKELNIQMNQLIGELYG